MIQEVKSFRQPSCSLRTRIKCTNPRPFVCFGVFILFFLSYMNTDMLKDYTYNCCLWQVFICGFYILSVSWRVSLQTFTSFVPASVKCREKYFCSFCIMATTLLICKLPFILQHHLIFLMFMCFWVEGYSGSLCKM